MGTLLTNDKMSPELRARIEASVRGRRGGAPQGGPPPRLRATLRLVMLVCIVGSVSLLGHRWQQQRDQVTEARARVHGELTRQLAQVPPGADQKLTRARTWLMRAASDDEDFLAPSLQQQGALSRTLSRGALYARGPLRAFRMGSRLTTAVEESVKDAFVTCLVAPPKARSEEALLPTVRAVYRGSGRLAKRTDEVYRLHDLVAAEPLLEEGWDRRILEAEDIAELHALRRKIEQADLGRAAAAARAELLIYVVDEPKKPGTPSELDGASDHMVRVGIVDLVADEVLLRRRQRVDPSWISEARRVDSARGLNGCRLAVDLRVAVAGRDGDEAAAVAASTSTETAR